jgi:hypothetical protein
MTPCLFADTNWLVAMYFCERDGDRSAIVQRFLSFDSAAKALAVAEHLQVFPALDEKDKGILALLRA